MGRDDCHEQALTELLKRCAPAAPPPPPGLAHRLVAAALATPQRRQFWAEGWFERRGAWPVALACTAALIVGVAVGIATQAPSAAVSGDTVASLWLDEEVP